MEIKITGKEVKATEAIKDYVEKKLARIEKYFDNSSINAVVTIKTEGKEQIAEMCVKVKGDTYRTEVASNDLYASIDKNIDILEGQIRKFKTKKTRSNDTIRIAEPANQVIIENEITKTIYYEIKPMTAEDAKLKLEEKPSNKFYTFINVDTNKVNVIYRLKDGKNFGLVEPEA